ncbi:MAG: diadenylate cyclase [Acidimicrobiales bacterium]
MPHRPPNRAHQRLADEFAEDGIVLPADAASVGLVIEELDYARRSPMFEGRRPVYGAIITSDPDTLSVWDDVAVDLVEVACGLDEARTFADGRAAFMVRDPHRPGRPVIACFGRSLQFESDLVRLQRATGALVVQRTPVFGVSRVFGPNEVVSWNGGSWERRTTAHGVLPILLRRAPHLDPTVVAGVLNLAVHWLAPARAGATLIIDDRFDEATLDTTDATFDPGFDVTRRSHFPALLSGLMQRDLATIVRPDGTIRAFGVGLRVRMVQPMGADRGHGMRHRSARHWSVDHPDALAIVVSADGPVTAYHAGQVAIGRL